MDDFRINKHLTKGTEYFAKIPMESDRFSFMKTSDVELQVIVTGDFPKLT